MLSVNWALGTARVIRGCAKTVLTNRILAILIAIKEVFIYESYDRNCIQRFARTHHP